MNLKGKANHARQQPWQIMQIGTSVKFSRQSGTRSEQQSNKNSSFELGLDLNFASFIQQPDY